MRCPQCETVNDAGVTQCIDCGRTLVGEHEACVLTQKKIEDFLSEMGFKPTDEYEEGGICFTKYEAVDIGVRIERNL